MPLLRLNMDTLVGTDTVNLTWFAVPSTEGVETTEDYSASPLLVESTIWCSNYLSYASIAMRQRGRSLREVVICQI
jgi:hypothetical protein